VKGKKTIQSGEEGDKAGDDRERRWLSAGRLAEDISSLAV
jgi:hypothetical protein